jgi:hypothetical protein
MALTLRPTFADPLGLRHAGRQHDAALPLRVPLVHVRRRPLSAFVASMPATDGAVCLQPPLHSDRPARDATGQHQRPAGALQGPQRARDPACLDRQQGASSTRTCRPPATVVADQLSFPSALPGLGQAQRDVPRPVAGRLLLQPEAQEQRLRYRGGVTRLTDAHASGKRDVGGSKCELRRHGRLGWLRRERTDGVGGGESL